MTSVHARGVSAIEGHDVDMHADFKDEDDEGAPGT